MCLNIQYQDLYFNIKFYRLRFWKKKHVINGMYNVECTLYIVQCTPATEESDSQRTLLISIKG